MEAQIKPKSPKKDSKILFFLLAFSLEDGEKMIEKMFKNVPLNVTKHVTHNVVIDINKCYMANSKCY